MDEDIVITLYEVGQEFPTGGAVDKHYYWSSSTDLTVIRECAREDALCKGIRKGKSDMPQNVLVHLHRHDESLTTLAELCKHSAHEFYPRV